MGVRGDDQFFPTDGTTRVKNPTDSRRQAVESWKRYEYDWVLRPEIASTRRSLQILCTTSIRVFYTIVV